ncbi:MAG: (2Fe-2S) ferredoxin domain-containing protein [Panacagrimonas sp.]
MSFYQHHVFFCCNQRAPGGRTCCNDKGASAARDHAKKRIKALGLASPGKVRVNQAGCMERCEQGPCVAIYPQAVWYTYQSSADVDEIIDRHIVGGEIVERLRIPDRR